MRFYDTSYKEMNNTIHPHYANSFTLNKVITGKTSYYYRKSRRNYDESVFVLLSWLNCLIS